LGCLAAEQAGTAILAVPLADSRMLGLLGLGSLG